MILNIKSQSKDDTNGLPLFQGIDFCADTKEIYIDRIKGQGGSAHVFSFYKIFEAKARQMVTGLGVFLADKYGTDEM